MLGLRANHNTALGVSIRYLNITLENAYEYENTNRLHIQKNSFTNGLCYYHRPDC